MGRSERGSRGFREIYGLSGDLQWGFEGVLEGLKALPSVSGGVRGFQVVSAGFK